MDEEESDGSGNDEYSMIAASNRFAALLPKKKANTSNSTNANANITTATRASSTASNGATAGINPKLKSGGNSPNYAGNGNLQNLASGTSSRSTVSKQGSGENGQFWAGAGPEKGGTAASPALPWPPFLHRYDVQLGCHLCFDTTKSSFRIMIHDCKYSQFLCRLRVGRLTEEEVVAPLPKRDVKWYLVREYSPGICRVQMCPNGQFRCAKGIACPYAHSAVELQIWGEEHGGVRGLTASLRQSILNATIINSDKQEILPFPNSKNNHVSVWRGCSICATFVRREYYVLRHWEHKCDADIIFIRYDFRPGAQREFWIFIRSSPTASQRKSGFDICHHIEQGCWRGYQCRFPHTEFESFLWELDKCRQFPLTNFLRQVCLMGLTTAANWKPITLTSKMEPATSTMNGVINRPPRKGQRESATGQHSATGGASASGADEGDWRRNAKPMEASRQTNQPATKPTGTGQAPSSAARSMAQPTTKSAPRPTTPSPAAATSGGGDNFRCPFNVRFICHSCYKNGGSVVYQNGTYCGSRNANHTWQQHKGIAIIDDYGKAVVIRDLPAGLSRAQRQGKPSVVRMCKRMETYKKCTLAICDYAHNEVERKCWMWLLKAGQSLVEVAERMQSAVEQHKAAAAAMAAKPTVSAVPQPGNAWTTNKKLFEQNKPASNIGQSGQPAPSGPFVPSGPSLLAFDQGPQVQVFYCYLCDKSLAGHDRFEEHINAKIHQERLRLVEDGHVWRFRTPPGPPPFKLCPRHMEGEGCVYSTSAHNRCPNAHSTDELEEWKERIEFLKRALTRKSSQQLQELHGKIREAQNLGKSILSPCMDDVEINCDGNMHAAVAEEKGQTYVWKFTIVAEKSLKRVILLDHDSASYFRLRSPFMPTNDEEIQLGDVFADDMLEGLYEVNVEFLGSNTPQTFTQRVAFDFGIIPIVYRELVVHSGMDKASMMKLQSLRYLLQSSADRWTPENADIIWISKERSFERMDVANVVANLNFAITEANYFSLLKQWLFAEQYRRQSILDEMEFKDVQITATPVLIDDDYEEMYCKTDGAYFAVVPLVEKLSEDMDFINLLRGSCLSAFIAPSSRSNTMDGKKPRVHEVNVVNSLTYSKDGVFSDRVHLELSKLFVRHMKLREGSNLKVDIQFNLYTKNFRQWLRGLERLQERQLSPLIFPDLLAYYSAYASGKIFEANRPKILNWPSLMIEWKRLHNPEQFQVMEHVVLCAVDRKNWIPPLVVFGPFGTGKTRTLAAAAATLIRNFPNTKILICTHAQVTADMYIDLLLRHTGMKNQDLKKILWRVFHTRTHVNPQAEEFMRFLVDPRNGRLRPEPLTPQKLAQMRVVICTFTASAKFLKVLDEDESVSFTHIFIDEAAQALELETVLPLCLARRSTCVVVAGDHHQIRPPVYLPQAKELGRSYLERLYYFYDKQKNSMAADARAAYRFPSILFNKNYRCHPKILSFLSSAFYGDPNCLVPCVEDYDGKEIKPLYFVASTSDEEVGRNASIINPGEAMSVVEQVEYLWHNWPREWGEKNIGVAVPYVEQGTLIRQMLKSRNISTHSSRLDVARVIQMQGKEYKALVISTVRGKSQLQNAQAMGNLRDRNLGFLDDPRLINTAMTRAKYTVIAVGNAEVLCTLGECRDIWNRYVETCAENGTLLPNTASWDELKTKIAWIRANTKISKHGRVAETTTADDLLVQQLMRKTESEVNA